MKLLVDTHLLVWQATGSRRLSPRAIELLDDQENELWFSVVSLWEVVIKSSLPRGEMNVDAKELRFGLQETGYSELTVGSKHVFEVGGLEPRHRDPFDRLMLAQARIEGMTLLTSDRDLLAYGYPTVNADR